MTIGNLAPSTAYTFTVMAVDSLGYASAPSDAGHGDDAAADPEHRGRARLPARVDRRELQGVPGALPGDRHRLPDVLRVQRRRLVLRRRRAADHELGAGARREGRGALELPAHDDPALHARRPGHPCGARDADGERRRREQLGRDQHRLRGRRRRRPRPADDVHHRAGERPARAGQDAVDGGLGQGEGRPEPSTFDVLRLRRARPARRHDLRHVLGHPLEDVGARARSTT